MLEINSEKSLSLEELFEKFPELKDTLQQMTPTEREKLIEYLQTPQEVVETVETPTEPESQDISPEQDISSQYLKKYDDYLQEQDAINAETELIKNRLSLQGFSDYFKRDEGINYDFLDCIKNDNIPCLCWYDKKNKTIQLLRERKWVDYLRTHCNRVDERELKKRYKCISLGTGTGKTNSYTIYDTETGKEIVSTAVGDSVSANIGNNTDTYFCVSKELDDDGKSHSYYYKYYNKSGTLLYEGKNIGDFYYDEASQQIAIGTYVGLDSEKNAVYNYEIINLATKESILTVKSNEPGLQDTTIGKRIYKADQEFKASQDIRNRESEEKKIQQEKFCKITSDGDKNVVVKNNKGEVLFQGGNDEYSFRNDSYTDFIVLMPQKNNEQNKDILHIFDQGKLVNLSIPSKYNASVNYVKKIGNMYTVIADEKFIVYYNNNGVKQGRNWRDNQNLQMQQDDRYQIIRADGKNPDVAKYQFLDTEQGTVLEDKTFTTMHHVFREDDKIVCIVSNETTPEKKEVIVLPLDETSQTQESTQ